MRKLRTTERVEAKPEVNASGANGQINGQQAEVVKQPVFVNSLRTRDYGLNAQ